MPYPQYPRILFRAGAVWSWLVSVAFFLGDTFNEPNLRRFVARVEPRFVLDHAVLPTFLFGFALWWVARDPDRNRLIVVIAASGSVLAFVLFLFRAWRHEMPWAFLPAVAIDLTFGLLFFHFLWTTRGRT